MRSSPSATRWSTASCAFGTMAPKAAIKDVARVQKLPLSESNRISKLVPEKPGTTFAKAYKEVPELVKEKESDNPLIRDTMKYAEKLEAFHRRAAVRTVQRRHIYAAVVLLHITPDNLFAVRTKIMRVKRIDFRNARHRRCER